MVDRTKKIQALSNCCIEMKVVGVTVMMMMTASAVGIAVGWRGFGAAKPQSQFIEAFF